MKVWFRMAVVMGCLAGGSACDDEIVSVYTARAYEPEGKCLDEYAPIGAVQTNALSSLCQPTCLKVGASLYVSTVCPPYPAEATAVSTAEAPACTEALAAAKANTTCAAP